MVKKIELSQDGITFTEKFSNLEYFTAVIEDGANSLNTDEGFSYGETPQVTTLSLSCSGTHAQIREILSYKHIKVSVDGALIFSGYNPSVEEEVLTDEVRNCQITYSSYASYFETVTFSEDVEFTYPSGIKVCDPSDTAHSLVHILVNKLFTNAPHAFTLHCTYSDTTVVAAFAAAMGDSVYAVLTEVLEQLGLTFYISGYNLYVIDMLETPSGAAINIVDFESGMTLVEKAYEPKQLPVIRPCEYHRVDNTLLGQYQTSEQKVNIPPNDLQTFKVSLQYKAGDNTKVVLYIPTSCELIGATRGFISDYGIELYGWEKSEYNEVTARVKNEHALFTYSFKNIYVHGSVAYLDYNKRVVPQDTDPNMPFTVKDEEKKVDYITTEAQALRYLKAMLYGQYMDSRTYEVYTTQNLALNTYCTISGETGFFRVIRKQCTYDAFGGYTYTLAAVFNDGGLSYDSSYVAPIADLPEVRPSIQLQASRYNILYGANGSLVDSTSIRIFVTALTVYVQPTLKIDGVERTLTPAPADGGSTDETTVGDSGWYYDLDPHYFDSRDSAVASAEIAGSDYKEIHFTKEVAVLKSASDQYYYSSSIDELRPNAFKLTQDITPVATTQYYTFTPQTGFVPCAKPLQSFAANTRYYEDASWLDNLLVAFDGSVETEGSFLATQDPEPVVGKTYYVWNASSGWHAYPDLSSFAVGVTYYEFTGFKGYVWYRTKYVYSDRSVTYSNDAYYLQPSDVANPFTITTSYGTSTGTEMIPTQDVTAQSNKEYYILVNNKYIRLSSSEGWPTGVTIYEIPGFVGWSNGIPGTWRKGLYVWYKETTVYDNQPQNILEDEPKYSVRLTQQMESTCTFSGELEEYTWHKNMRSTVSEDVSILIHMNIIGYGQTAIPIVRDLPAAVRVTSNINNIVLYFASNIDVESFSFQVGLLYPTEDTSPQSGKTYYYFDSTTQTWAIFTGATFLIGVEYYEDYPNVSALSFTINSIDVTVRGMYLGMLNALPTSTDMYYLDGDHFVPTQNITSGGVTYNKYMPYVYLNGSWVPVEAGQAYGTETAVQIMYNCAKDIYDNATYTYQNCASGAVAQAGVSYYDRVTHEPVIVAVGDDVSNLCTRYLDVPQAVIDYYNYQEKLMAEHIIAEDIELMRSGKIRSAGYQKGTARKIMDEMAAGHSVDMYRKGFYGDYDGNFEAYSAILVNANIYYCNIVGELRNELFETQLIPQIGSRYTQNTLADESWDANEGMQAAKDAGMSEDAVTAIACQYNGTAYTRGMIVSNNTKKVDITLAPDGTYQMPIKASLSSVTGRLFVGSTEVYQNSTIAYGSTIKNKKRWYSNNFINNSGLGSNELKVISGTVYRNGSAYSCNGLVYVANPSATAASGYTWTGHPQYAYTQSSTIYVAAPDYITDGIAYVTVKANESYWYYIGGTNYRWGDVTVEIIRHGGVREVCARMTNTKDVYVIISNVSGGDRIMITMGGAYQPGSLWGSGGYEGTYEINVPSQTFRDMGMSTEGIYSFKVATGYEPSLHYLKDITRECLPGFAYFEENLGFSWNGYVTANNCENATFSYTYALYDAGFNFLNASADKQAALSYGMKSIATTFQFTNFNGHSWDSNNVNNHYFHFNSKPLKEDNVPIETGKIYNINYSAGYTHSFSYQKKEGSVVTGTDIKGVIWSSITVIIERTNSIEMIDASDWLKSFTIDFTALARARGNYADTILPRDREEVRDHEINLGSPDNRFDAVHTKQLGTSNIPVDNAYLKNIFEYVNNQSQKIDDLYVKISQVEQSVSSSTSKIPSSKAVNDAIMNIITWNYLGSVSVKGPALTVPASASHVLCIIQDTYSEPRTASLDLYPGISKSGYYAIGAYYFNGAGLGSQIKWDGTNRTVSFNSHYTDATQQNSGVTLYVYYR